MATARSDIVFLPFFLIKKRESRAINFTSGAYFMGTD